ncbi:hypothetical protein [Rhodanobacter sp. DHB23]|uniref:hypothetical protein n=1 Tax=Rhodanobacter sp. DHB23 TaxID=2775923 RepID=UPI0017822CD0|nr:hypothetical protein [Rhodanobacter sp. DHB23]MBD8872286.1 hypothetical protein [Rhodanobacter sp. DHB23]
MPEANAATGDRRGVCFGDSFAIIPDREDQTGGHPWPHFSILLRSSLIAKIKRAAIRGRTFQFFCDRP